MKRLLLVGGGHAHAALLLDLAASKLTGVTVMLVTPDTHQTYSGMLPGLIAGHYSRDDIQIDVASLAQRSGVELVVDRAVALDAARRCVTLGSGREIGYDLASLNLGSLPNNCGVPGAKECAIAVKPFEEFLAAWERLRAKAANRSLQIAVVGAGAAGVELALAMRFALASSGTPPGVVLFSDKPFALPDHPPAAQRSIARLLSMERVELRVDTRIAGVEPGFVTGASGRREAFDAVVWVAGAAPQPWFRNSGLGLDKDGFILVDATLRSVTNPEVFAAGDSATLDATPHPKSGVYAIRQATVLAHNIRSSLSGGRSERFVPQKDALALISIGRKYCLATRGQWTLEGEWLWRVKDSIDRRWIRRFH
ncbi:MAG: FAD-dependent oxidoreductase [Betaproteobacteria bacterium]|nr:FAD-dependent oxidoreductase [Betaproteobacteria bacterium]